MNILKYNDGVYSYFRLTGHYKEDYCHSLYISYTYINIYTRHIHSDTYPTHEHTHNFIFIIVGSTSINFLIFIISCTKGIRFLLAEHFETK